MSNYYYLLLLLLVLKARAQRRAKMDRIVGITPFASEDCPHSFYLRTADVAFSSDLVAISCFLLSADSHALKVHCCQS